MPTASGDLHLGQYKRIQKFSGEVGDKGSDQKAGGKSKYGPVGPLGFLGGPEAFQSPEGRRREDHGKPNDDKQVGRIKIQ